MGVPQGSILGPLLFLLYINDLPNCLSKSTPILFADDTTVVKSGTNLNDLYRDMNSELSNLENWCLANKLSLNAKKTKYIVFKPKKTHVHHHNLNFGGVKIERIGHDCKVNAFKFLGHWVDDSLNWDFHTNKLINKLNSTNYILAKTKNIFPLGVRKTIYSALAQSHLVWGSAVTGATSNSNLNKIEATQNKIIRNLFNMKYNSHTLPVFYEHKLLKARDLIYYSQVLIGYKYRQGYLPNIFNKLLIYSYEAGDRSRREDCLNFHIPPNYGKGGLRYPLTEIIKSWNRLPYYYKSEFDTKFFKIMVKQYLNEKYSGFTCDKIKCYSFGTNV